MQNPFKVGDRVRTIPACDTQLEGEVVGTKEWCCDDECREGVLTTVRVTWSDIYPKWLLDEGYQVEWCSSSFQKVEA